MADTASHTEQQTTTTTTTKTTKSSTSDGAPKLTSVERVVRLPHSRPPCCFSSKYHRASPSLLYSVPFELTSPCLLLSICRVSYLCLRPAVPADLPIATSSLGPLIAPSALLRRHLSGHECIQSPCPRRVAHSQASIPVVVRPASAHLVDCAAHGPPPPTLILASGDGPSSPLALNEPKLTSFFLCLFLDCSRLRQNDSLNRTHELLQSNGLTARAYGLAENIVKTGYGYAQPVLGCVLHLYPQEIRLLLSSFCLAVLSYGKPIIDSADGLANKGSVRAPGPSPTAKNVQLLTPSARISSVSLDMVESRFPYPFQAKTDQIVVRRALARPWTRSNADSLTLTRSRPTPRSPSTKPTRSAAVSTTTSRSCALTSDRPG